MRIRDEVNIPSIETNFKVGGRPRWEPLAAITTGLGKAAFIETAASGLIGGRQPLTKSGQMRRAATAKARFQIRKNVMSYGEWPERRWFGPVHNLPDLSKRAKIPNRPFTLIYPEDKVAAGEIMLDWVEEQVRKNIRLRYA
jgi:phage gpG-like protein